MGRPKKDAAEKAEGATVPVEVEGVKKGAGRGKKKEKNESAVEMPKRTLRSNTKVDLVEAAAPAPVKQTKPKTKKTAEEPKVEVEDQTNDSEGTEEDVKNVKKVAVEKTKGRKKAAPATNGKAASEPKTEVKEEAEDVETDDSASKEKAEPVKASGGGKKKKTEATTVDAEENGNTEELPTDNGTNAKPAGGRGKKKTDKTTEDEVVAPKKSKKETTKAAKSKKVEPEETAEKESKPKANGKAAEVKEVVVEHCKS